MHTFNSPPNTFPKYDKAGDGLFSRSNSTQESFYVSPEYYKASHGLTTQTNESPEYDVADDGTFASLNSPQTNTDLLYNNLYNDEQPKKKTWIQKFCKAIGKLFKKNSRDGRYTLRSNGTNHEWRSPSPTKYLNFGEGSLRPLTISRF